MFISLMRLRARHLLCCLARGPEQPLLAAAAAAELSKEAEGPTLETCALSTSES